MKLPRHPEDLCIALTVTVAMWLMLAAGVAWLRYPDVLAVSVWLTWSERSPSIFSARGSAGSSRAEP